MDSRTTSATFLRLYSDEEGESHFDDVEYGLSSVDYAPPAAPFDVSSPTAAERLVFFHLPSGWEGDFHPSPRRQFFIGLSGDLEISASDGDTRRFPPGSIVLIEDTHGKGHSTRAVGRVEYSGAFVHLE
jgi:hypothetical protein